MLETGLYSRKVRIEKVSIFETCSYSRGFRTREVSVLERGPYLRGFHTREVSVLENARPCWTGVFIKRCCFNVLAAEWRRNLPDRTVNVKLGPGKIIKVSSERGQLLRTVDLRGMEWIIIFLQSDREQTMLSVRMDREYDMVSLKFSNSLHKPRETDY